MINLIEEEKANAKLLYLFEPDLFNHLKMINESSSDGSGEKKAEGVIKKTIKSIFKALKSVFIKFIFVVALTFLLIITSIELDFIVMVKKAFAGVIFGAAFKMYIERGLNAAVNANVNLAFKTRDFLVDNKFYDKIDLYNLKAFKTEKDKKGREVTKKVDILDALEKISIQPNKFGFEAKKLRQQFEPDFYGKISTQVGISNWFGLKTIFDYLFGKAKRIQDYLSDLIALIVSIFKNEKVQFAENLKLKKQIKKLIYFKENILNVKKRKKEFFYEEVIKSDTGVGFTFGNNLKLFNFKFKINNSVVNVDSITKKITVVGDDFVSIYKKIFPDKNITTPEYSFQSVEDMQQLQTFFSNKQKNVQTQQAQQSQEQEQISVKNNKAVTTANKNEIEEVLPLNKISPTSDDDMSDKNMPKIGEDIKNKPPVLKYQIIHKVVKSGMSTYFIMALILIMALAGTFFSGGGSTAVAASIEAGKASLDSGASAIDAISSAIESGKSTKDAIDAAKEAMDAKELAENAANLKGLNVIGNFISKTFDIDAKTVLGWLGWTSLGAGLTYPALKAYISKMTADDILETIDKVENNSEVKKLITNTSGNIESAINKTDNQNNKKEKKEGFISKTIKKVKNVFGSSPTNDSFDYTYKKELLYDESYIVNEYFKLEDKLYKTKKFHS